MVEPPSAYGENGIWWEAHGMRVIAAPARSRAPGRPLRLAGALLVAGTLAFVTALIAFLAEPSPVWLLYLIPVILAALAYDIPGGIAAAALSAVACALAVPAPLLEELWPELVTGFVVFAGCGAVVGFQAHRQRSHTAALEQASTLDPVTDTLKSEHLERQLAYEVRRAERYGHPLGLALVRVDDFESYTRVFGHYKAALMLAHLAGVIRLAARSTDLLGRTGAATFALVLPHASPACAQAVAERVNAACDAAAFEGDALEPVTRCRTLVSWASYPEEAMSHQELLDLTHERLEAAESAAPPPVAPKLVPPPPGVPHTEREP
jgi:diguanylate cyclase (GGDEF)-like protein